jgi:hypothetical protein
MFKIFLFIFITTQAFAKNPFIPPLESITVKDVTELNDANIGDHINKVKTDEKIDNSVKTVNSTIPSLEDKIQNWYIMSAVIKNRNVCYMVKYPEEQIGNHKETRKPYLMITFINSRRYEISISAGYKYRNNSVLNLSVDGTIFKLSANNDIAWSQGVFDDFAMLHTMMTSFRAMASSESSVGTYSVDTYDLIGFKEAYNKMISVCKK